jgi:hypothetical protein
MVRRVAPVLAAAAVGLLALAYGAAASLGIGSASLGAGDAAVQRCDTSFTRSLTVSGGNVTQVTIGDVASACGGGQMTVVLTNASGAKVGDGSAGVPSGGGSVTVPIDEQPSVGSVRNVHVAVVGP